MSSWLASLVGALLPEPERGAFVRRYGGRPEPASLAIGAVEFVAGAGLLYDSAMATLRAAAEAMASSYWEQANARHVGAEETLGLTMGGAVVWIAWLLDPRTLALLSIPATGLARAVSYLTIQEAFGEPVVWLGLRLARLLRRLGGRLHERSVFGAADVPDEVEPAAGGALLVHTARPRPEWNDLVTIEVAERFYRVTGRDLVEGPAGRRHRYRLEPAPQHEVIRRLLRYEPPAGGGARRSVGTSSP